MGVSCLLVIQFKFRYAFSDEVNSFGEIIGARKEHWARGRLFEAESKVVKQRLYGITGF